MHDTKSMGKGESAEIYVLRENPAIVLAYVRKTTRRGSVNERCEKVRKKLVADSVASCSNPGTIATWVLVTLTQPMKMLRQLKTREGLHSTNPVTVAGYAMVGGWTVLSSDT